MADLPARARLCPVCRAWLLREEDAWCGHCAAPSAQFRFTLAPDVLQVKNIAPPIQGSLTNLSCAELSIDRLELPDWLGVTPLPATLAPGASQQFTAKARTLALETPQAASCTVSTGAGNAVATLLLIEDVPTFITEPAELEVWGTGLRTLDFLLAPRAGALRMRTVARGPLGEVSPSTPLTEPAIISTAGIPVSIRVDADRLRRNPAASLLVGYDGPFGPREVELPLRFVLREPPQLRWAGENSPPVELFASTGQRLELAIANQSLGARAGARNARLTLQTVQLASAGDHDRVKAKLLTALPILLRGGESATLTFELDLNEVRGAAPQPLRLLLAATADAATLECAVPVLVRQLPVFDGVLAIDFGSSNTCAAAVETGREVEPLPLDGAAEISPTLLRYDDLAEPYPQVETGARIQRLATVDNRSAASILGALKQRLGDARQDLPLRPYYATEWTTRTATAAATDYLREIRRIAEKHKQTVFRDFILTHPAVCSLQQYRNLRTALQTAFAEAPGQPTAQIRFLQEPLAALISFFAQRAAVKSQAPVYTVASVDLGGGTTDLAIVRVEHTSASPGRMEVRPTILYSRGVRFGGEDLTAFLVTRMHAAAVTILAQARPGAAIVQPDTPGAAAEEVLRNRVALESVAEQFKISLSDEAPGTSVPSTGSDLVILRVLAAGSLAAEDFPVAIKDLTSARGLDIKAAFLAEITERVGAIARLLDEAAQTNGALDFIQLSGKTSYLPSVSACLRKQFPQTKVVRAGSPKECVVTGACLSRSLSRNPAQRLILPDAATRTTSDIGLYDTFGSQFTSILPVDTAVPASGLERSLGGAWFGSEPVVLWENLGVSNAELRTTGGSRLLAKLGTWQPATTQTSAEADGWALRLKLLDFELQLSAIGPAGETVEFLRLEEAQSTGGRP